VRPHQQRRLLDRALSWHDLPGGAGLREEARQEGESGGCPVVSTSGKLLPFRDRARPISAFRARQIQGTTRNKISAASVRGNAATAVRNKNNPNLTPTAPTDPTDAYIHLPYHRQNSKPLASRP
jgi:hypothetical protein